MLRKHGKKMVFLHLEVVYVKEAWKKEGLSSRMGRLC
ncbi:hypothetical protein Bcoa_0267 [Heyndrickxia coagulans 36D1]|uniref:Uncharacterized protein n=1 Tax=Heyndrickxia coagulans 36D1 TaxID=345219 RepID=G2TMK1_HEYCO|nr:hypothetical protein Bcoa_0267 [Heyndrickxia coagulans 36D1]